MNAPDARMRLRTLQTYLGYIRQSRSVDDRNEYLDTCDSVVARALLSLAPSDEDEPRERGSG